MTRGKGHGVNFHPGVARLCLSAAAPPSLSCILPSASPGSRGRYRLDFPLIAIAAFASFLVRGWGHLGVAVLAQALVASKLAAETNGEWAGLS